MHLNQASKLPQRSTLDDTKSTFVDKLKNYQTLTSFSKTAKNSHNKFNHMFSDTSKSNFVQDLSYTSPRFGESLTKRLLVPTMPKNTVEEFKQKLYGKLDSCPDTSYSLIRTKFTTQQNYFDEQFQKKVHQVSLIENKFENFKDKQTQQTKQNFVKLDAVQKYLVTSQKAHHEDYTIVSEKSKYVVQQTIKQATEIITKTHKNHLEASLKAMTFIDQEAQSLSQALENESQMSQQEWCSGLDKINDEILALNTLITETKLDENNRFGEMQWRVKEIQFGCEECLERESKERVEKQSRLYMVLDKLIERVGTIAM